ncbi:hypothetical protein CYMTET_14425 [Cymbomonas tetramitiformis]|uniref:Uncharacterized protein n=1 Tax=Cymbomonas tetramitiformis TaxID=36881 RepID=A0AAE0LA14_9CHLO|nr:hypothetical protein CYMTET_14425 [Cymbomonas tetramitiformis]
MAEGAREVKCILNVVTDMVTVNLPAPMYRGSQGAIQLAADSVNLGEIGAIEPQNASDFTEDTFTTPFAGPSLTMLKERLGVMQLTEMPREGIQVGAADA